MADKQCGIYLITNTTNGKIYVGQSVNIKDRIAHHKSSLKGNRHCNTHLQSSWNISGERSFMFTIIELVQADKLNEREVYWINRFNTTNNMCGYNRDIPAVGEVKRVVSEATKLVMREAAQKRHAGAMSIKKMLIQQKEELKAQLRASKLPSKRALALRNSVKHKAHLERLHNTEENRARLRALAEAQKKDYIFVNSSGEVFRFRGLSAFCREQGLNKSDMAQVYKGAKKSCKGWRKYIEN